MFSTGWQRRHDSCYDKSKHGDRNHFLTASMFLLSRWHLGTCCYSFINFHRRNFLIINWVSLFRKYVAKLHQEVTYFCVSVGQYGLSKVGQPIYIFGNPRLVHTKDRNQTVFNLIFWSCRRRQDPNPGNRITLSVFTCLAIVSLWSQHDGLFTNYWLCVILITRLLREVERWVPVNRFTTSVVRYLPLHLNVVGRSETVMQSKFWWRLHYWFVVYHCAWFL